MILTLVFFSMTLVAADGFESAVDPRSLPPGWFSRDARAFMKLGLPPERLVFDPTPGKRPIASVQVLKIPLSTPLTNDPRSWTVQLMPEPGGWQFISKPILSLRRGHRVFRARMMSDSKDGSAHYFAVAAIELNHEILILFFQQNRDAYLRGLPAVRQLFARVRPA